MSVPVIDNTNVFLKNKTTAMNSAIFALKEFQEAMQGEAENAGLHSDNDVIELIMNMRHENDV
jgi:hypothetical protein